MTPVERSEQIQAVLDSRATAAGVDVTDGGYASYFRFMPMLCLGYSNLMSMLCLGYSNLMSRLYQPYANVIATLITLDYG